MSTATTEQQIEPGRVLADLHAEETVLRGRRAELVDEQVRVTDSVVRGTAERKELTAITKRITDIDEALRNLDVMRARARVLASEQLAREERRVFDEALEKQVAENQRAVAEGHAIDALIVQLGERVERLVAHAVWHRLRAVVANDRALEQIADFANRARGQPIARRDSTPPASTRRDSGR